ncbi:MAG: M23 family metallopeptidase [Cytophagales bacterium]|nr:M23 family metallopeptidase [Cytophagales bacterium]
MKSSKGILFNLLFFHVMVLQAQAVENPYMFPVRPGQQNYLSGTMGELRGAHFHGGMDIKTGGTTGLKIHAAADGYVSRIKVDGNGYGNAIYIAHPQLGTTTVYGHLKTFDEDIAEYVLKEQYKRKRFSVDLFPEKTRFKIKRGDIVAFSGNSGSSGGPHLHFEIRDKYQRPINPLGYDFSEIKDNIRPSVEKIALKTMNKDSRVNHQFGFFEFSPSKLNNEYTVSETIEVYGEIGVLIMGYDRLNNALNKNGIPNLTMTMDGEQVIDITIDKIPFSKNRNILCYRDYALKIQENKSFQKLFIDDGNELNIYDTDHRKGIISITDTLVHHIKITLMDAHGNSSAVHLKVKGCKPKVTAMNNVKNFRPFRHVIVDNTLVFMGKKAKHNGFFANVFANRMNYELSSSYYVNDYSVYLWDLRTGTPDSIDLCGDMIYPGLEMIVPSESEFKYFKSEFDLHFYTKTLFDTLYLKTDYMDELDDEKEFFEIGKDIYPLKKSLKIKLKPKRSYDRKDKISAYYTTDLKNFSFQGGIWINNTFEIMTRMLGKYTLLADTIPPKIKVVQQNRDHFRCYITDDMSGIKDYELYINNKWVLMNYDPKRNYIWAEKLDKSKPFTGNLELKVRDNVNNEKIYSTIIN